MFRRFSIAARVLVFLQLPFLTTSGLAQNRQPYIINGLPTEDFPAVGIVGEASVGGFCTGTLITSTHVLTAAHCAEAILRLGDEQSGTFEVNGQVYSTSQVQILSTYDAQRFTDDVAILVLSDPVEDIVPAILADFPPQAGELVTIVGYGGQGSPDQGSDGSFGTKLVGEATVDSVTETEISWTFDDPTESNPAPGDSGGPVFLATADGPMIAGVISSGTTINAELGDISYSMRVDAYRDWIEQVVIATQVTESENTGEDETPLDEDVVDSPPTPEIDPEIVEDNPQADESDSPDAGSTDSVTNTGDEDEVSEATANEDDAPVTESPGSHCKNVGHGGKKPSDLERLCDSDSKRRCTPLESLSASYAQLIHPESKARKNSYRRSRSPAWREVDRATARRRGTR